MKIFKIARRSRRAKVHGSEGLVDAASITIGSNGQLQRPGSGDESGAVRGRDDARVPDKQDPGIASGQRASRRRWWLWQTKLIAIGRFHKLAGGVPNSVEEGLWNRRSEAGARCSL